MSTYGDPIVNATTLTSSVSTSHSQLTDTSHSSHATSTDLNATSQHLYLNSTTTFSDSSSRITTESIRSGNKPPTATVLGLFFAIVICVAVVAIYLYVRNRRKKRKNLERMELRGRDGVGVGRGVGEVVVKETVYSDVVRAIDLEEVAAAAIDKETHYITIDFDSNGRLEEEEEEEEEETTLLETSIREQSDNTQL